MENTLFSEYFLEELEIYLKNNGHHLEANQKVILDEVIQGSIEILLNDDRDSTIYFNTINKIKNYFIDDKETKSRQYNPLLHQAFQSWVSSNNLGLRLESQTEILQNGRDSLMARNLNFIIDNWQEEKIIAWGASYHFGYTYSNIEINETTINYLKNIYENESSDERILELKNSLHLAKTMSSFIELEKSSMLTIGFISYGGSFGVLNEKVNEIKSPPPNSFESEIYNDKLDTVYIDLSNYDEFRYASVLGNVPIYNNWSESFDFFIYIEESSPPKKIVYNELQKNEISE